MRRGFKYRVEGKKLIIESCPNNTINMNLVNELQEKDLNFNEIYMCEGIKEIEEDSFRYLNNVVKITLPNSLKRIGRQAFYNCLNLKEISFPDNPNNLEIEEAAFMCCKSLLDLNIPNGVRCIKGGAFCHCESLENVYLPDSVEMLDNDVFSCCYNLKVVRLPVSLEKIRSSTFYYCKNLENVILPKGIKQIEESAFEGCWLLKSVTLPNSLVEIDENAFCSCKTLKNIDFNEGLEQIGINAFSHCENLEEIILPSSLKYVGKRAFGSCGELKKVVMNDGVTKIGSSVFDECNKLEDIRLSNSLKEIPYNTFSHCSSLKKIVLPDSVQILNEYMFRGCGELKEIVLSKNIKKIPASSFGSCYRLERIVIPEGVEEIGASIFSNSFKLKEVCLPSTLKKFDVDAFWGCEHLSYVYLKSKDGIIKIDVANGDIGFFSNPDNLLFVHSFDDDMSGFYKDGEYIEFNEKLLYSNDKISQIIEENSYDRGMFIKLYYWSKKRFIPSSIVIENMPLDDIDKFYINNNGKEWQKLINSSVNVNLDENKASFFKLCYVLGVFSESVSVRDRAVKFLNERIVNVLDGYTIHSKFDGFDLSNGFNEEYAEFFMKYYNHRDFMVYEDEYGDNIDLMAASYNNFRNVKKVYPNKTLHTNREADLLLPEHVMNVARIAEYDDVDEENKEFALTIGRYGYTQEQFEKVQEWYNVGKTIKEMKLFIGEDEETKGITYKLLSKDDPLNAVLGNITNCCQVIGGAGEECVEYGMTRPNSGFITFNYKDKIIGQAWVWYDESSKTVCLDNIEVPHRYLEKISQNKAIQKSFIDCLLRIEKNFKEAMNERGLEVNKVTIGEGYNDIKEILDRNFPLVKKCSCLSDYSGYSDANDQYEIKKIEQNNNRK